MHFLLAFTPLVGYLPLLIPGAVFRRLFPDYGEFGDYFLPASYISNCRSSYHIGIPFPHTTGPLNQIYPSAVFHTVEDRYRISTSACVGNQEIASRTTNETVVNRVLEHLKTCQRLPKRAVLPLLRRAKCLRIVLIPQHSDQSTSDLSLVQLTLPSTWQTEEQQAPNHQPAPDSEVLNAGR